jgi:peptidoglycan/xylan/chitin deacetylase (PgdA/CDA1 family)
VTLVVTTSWDDGHVLDRRVGELLARHRLSGTFYIAPRNREIPAARRLDGRGIVELAERYEIGGHTLTHQRLTDLDPAAARHEIEAGKHELEDLLGRGLTSFCYPYGAYHAGHLSLAARAGFTLARTVRRFRVAAGPRPFETPTTVHAYRHMRDAAPAARLAGWRPARAVRYWRCWDDLAIAAFERARRDGGVYHLWGHSWEVDRYGDWGRLERVLEHVAGRADVRYADNATAYRGGGGDVG